MNTINILYSKKKDLLSVKDKIEGYPRDQILIQVFSGVHDRNAVDSLRKECIKLFPGVAIIGTTTSGEIIGSVSKEHSVVISVSFFKETKVRSLIIEQNDDLKSAAKAAADFFKQFDPRALIIFGCGLKDGNIVNDFQFIEEIGNRLNKVLIAGGQAGVNSFSEKTFVFTENGITGTGFALSSLSGNALRIENAYNFSWVPLGKKMTITGVHGNTVYEIDGKSVKDIYRQYLGIENVDHPLFLINEFPLMMEREGVLVTNPVSFINNDGSFEYIHKLHLGEQVSFSFIDVSLQEDGAMKLKEILFQQKPESVFVYSCALRKLLLGEDIMVDISALEELPSSAGFFTYGEYYTDKKYNPHLFQQTMTVLSLSESELITHPKDSTGKNASEKRQDSMRFKVLKILNHLIGKIIEELEQKNDELNKIANKDALTGLSNRRYFYETFVDEIKSNNRADTPLSLILLDVDFFKQFNDIYGHVAGDDCLRCIGNVLGKEIGRTSDMAFRYGGEEFGCLLPYTKYGGALVVAERIRSNIEKLVIPHEGSKVSNFVTVSLGVITLNCSSDSDPVLLVNLCDELLYEAKRNGRNCVVGKDIAYFDNLKEKE